jgi:hypothetical protein
VDCQTLKNNGGTASCCATGYVFDPALAICKCENSKGYVIGPNGICTPCIASDSNCANCINTYIFNNLYCIHGSLIPNYNFIETYSCNPGYSFKRNYVNGAIVACACSGAAQYYQNGSKCVACSASLPSGVSLVNCQSCAVSAGFYLGAVECIYCPRVPFAYGTASSNGCDCLFSYYWNTTSNQC